MDAKCLALDFAVHTFATFSFAYSSTS